MRLSAKVSLLIILTGFVDPGYGQSSNGSPHKIHIGGEDRFRPMLYLNEKGKPLGVGTSLGLSVSYFIITENQGGSMAVESTLVKGATFIIRLPIERNKHEGSQS